MLIRKRFAPLLGLLILSVGLVGCGAFFGAGGGTDGGSGGGTGSATPPDGVVTFLVGMTGGSGSSDGSKFHARLTSPQDVVTDGTYLFVADTQNHTIRKITIATGEVTTLAGLAGSQGSADGTGTKARFSFPSGLAIHGDKLYVADTYNHTIRQIVIATGAVTTLAGKAESAGFADGSGDVVRFHSPLGVATDGTKVFVADSDNHLIRQIVISSGVVTTLAGTQGVPGIDDGTGTAAEFHSPGDVAFYGGNLYVADTGNSKIRQIVISSGVVTSLTGYSSGLNCPYGLTTDGTNLYVANTCDFTVAQLSVSGGAVTILAGKTNTGGSADGIGTAARFTLPRGITVDGTNLYLADTDNHLIRKVVVGSQVVSTFAGGRPSLGYEGRPGTSAEFYAPSGLAMDGTNLYVTNAGESAIRKIIPASGTVSILAGGGGPIFGAGYDDGVGTEANFASPRDIVALGDNLYVADTDNSLIRKIVIETAVVSTLAGTGGSWGPGGSGPNPGSADGTGPAAEFNSPRGITTDGTYLFVADTQNHTIRKIVIETAVVTTLAGTAESAGSADGTGSAARFHSPRGITTDGTYLYVADTQNHTIRKIVIATGKVTTLAGTAESMGFTDGTGPAARFAYPEGVATDGTYLYVTDTHNSTIRQIVLATGEVTTLAGTVGQSSTVEGTGAVARFSSPMGIVVGAEETLFVSNSGEHNIVRIE